MNSNSACRLLFSTSLIVSLIGCGGADQPPMAEVRGLVTLDGNPVDHGKVYFIPEKGQMAMAEIDKDGRYVIQSAGNIEGALIGKHKIRVEIRQPPKNSNDTQPPLIHPEKYNDPNTSGLTAEVKAGTENVVDIPLKSTP